MTATRTFDDFMIHRAGYLARSAGRGMAANPYSEGDLRRAEWRGGWLACDADDDEHHSPAELRAMDGYRP